MSKENDNKILEQLKSGFKKTVKSNKYSSQITIQGNNNNLNYLIDPNLLKLTDCFNKTSERFFFTFLCTNVEINDLNVLIDRKSFFDLPVKMKKKLTKKLLKRVETMTAQLVIYWTLLTPKKIADLLQLI